MGNLVSPIVAGNMAFTIQGIGGMVHCIRCHWSELQITISTGSYVVTIRCNRLFETIPKNGHNRIRLRNKQVSRIYLKNTEQRTSIALAFAIIFLTLIFWKQIFKCRLLLETLKLCLFLMGNDRLSGKQVGFQAGLDPTCLHKYKSFSHTVRVNNSYVHLHR